MRKRSTQRFSQCVSCCPLAGRERQLQKNDAVGWLSASRRKHVSAMILLSRYCSCRIIIKDSRLFGGWELEGDQIGGKIRGE